MIMPMDRNVPQPDRTGGDVEEVLRDALAWLAAEADPGFRADMGPRYGIHTPNALGVRMARMKALAKRLGTDHALALALWESGGYEARMVASMVDDPAQVTSQQMDRWCRDFDNWAICDSLCFNLFDRTPHRWDKVDRWSGRKQEYVKRAGFALLWALALHDREADDARFRHGLALIDAHATDDRPMVEKAMAMALRSIGKRRPTLRDDVLDVAHRLAGSDHAPARRIGKSAVRELT
jgi:3-methyladenine DNA glycosylase AlkD